MTPQDAQNYLINAANAGTLLTPKHDPANLSTTYRGYRTVLASDLAGKLQSFVSGRDYTLREYENTRLPNSPYYLEIEPSPTSQYPVPGSGVAPSSAVASTSCDRLVAVSGQNQGWHVFAEESATIQRKVANGDLVFKGIL